MSAALTPASIAELVEAVRSTPQLIAVGAGTKPRLSAVNITKLSTTALRGLVEYEPSEFTFTARRGSRAGARAAPRRDRPQRVPHDDG